MKAIFCGSDNPASCEALKRLVNMSIGIEYCLLSNEKNADIIDYCINSNIPVVNTVDEIKCNSIDLLVSFSYKRLIPVSLINRARVAINCHPAPLPFYRGRGTTSQVLLQKGDKWGVTCHYIAEKFDTGRIIERRMFDITDNLRTGKELSDYSWVKCVELLSDVVGKIYCGIELDSYDQEKGGKYYSMADLQDAKKVSYNDSADVINTKIEALWFPPYGGAYIEIDNQKFYLMNERMLSEVAKMYNENK